MKLRIALPTVLFFTVLISSTASAQFKRSYAPMPMRVPMPTDNSVTKTKISGKWFIPGLTGDKDRVVYKPNVPSMVTPSSLPVSESYWIGSVTSQSYNQGKIGRYYYWDMQGNLRESYLFLDIAGKNKRGLKLVFPRRHGFIF
ncbi:MAG TPA: hypothetical protein VIU12_15265 [Chryseolinea sp.]